MNKTGLVIWLVAVSCLNPLAARSTDFEDDEAEMDMFFTEEETITSVSRHSQDIGLSPSAITVITAEDIAASGAQGFTDLLRLVPGFDVIQATPVNGSISTRSERTRSNNRYLLLLDGTELNVEIFGFSFPDVQLCALSEIDRIEIIRGPGSALYGSSAMTAVIHVFTRPIPEKTSARISLSGGELANQNLELSASSRLGKLGILLSGGYQYGGRFTDPGLKGKEVWRFRTRLDYALGSNEQLSLNFSINDGSGPIPTSLGDFNGGVRVSILRASYQSDNLKAHLYWMNLPGFAHVQGALTFGGIFLADFVPIEFDGHTGEAEIQWTLPSFYEPLMLITGAVIRVSQVSSDQLLDGENFSNLSSNRFHQLGIDYLEARAGLFVHGELMASDWLTLTADARLDYNTATGLAFSPRLAAVFLPAEEQRLRLSVARAFRKPSFGEYGLHPSLRFPPGSALPESSQDVFQEFMSRVAGNNQLENETVTAFEAGWQGRFFNGQVSSSLDLYVNFYQSWIGTQSKVVADQNGLPDLAASKVQYENIAHDSFYGGVEWSLRYQPSQELLLQFIWNHRQPLDRGLIDDSPHNLLTLGGRYQTSWGLVSSLYLFSRSEYTDHTVSNPKGLLEPLQAKKLDNAVLAMARLGYRMSLSQHSQLECGIRILLPINPYGDHPFRFREDGGGYAPDGSSYGAEELRRLASVYLEGQF